LALAVEPGEWKPEAPVSFVNSASREINCKIVYYGPGQSGKTTNLKWAAEQTQGGSGGRMVSLATEGERTLFFDFLPLELGEVHGFKVRFHLYTVPGQVVYDASRSLILRGADGVVLVADSQEARTDANLEALETLLAHLQAQGRDFVGLPYVLQLNKRDLPNCLPVHQLRRLLARKDEPVLEAVASRGVGVFETLREIGRLVLAEVRKG
jgi:mutual gliding-motility protein MglA